MKPYRKSFGIWVPDRSLSDNRGFISPVVVGAVAGSRRRTVAVGNIVADLWATFDDATNPATAASLKGTASGGSVAGSSWFTSGTQFQCATAAEIAMISTVNSTSDSGGTRGYVGNHNVPNYARIDLNTYPTSQSVGFWFKVTALSTNTYAHVAAQGEGSTAAACIAILRVENNSGAYTSFLYNSGGSSSTFSISVNTWYWAAIKYVKNGTCTLYLYDSTGASLGSPVTLAGQNKSTFYHFFGGLGSTSPTGDTYIDDYIIDKDADVFPFGP